MNLLNVAGLRAQRSKDFTLVIDSLSLQAGNILCVAGPNGSGKTTFIDCLAGLLTPTAGVVTINGQAVNNNLKAIKRTIGYVPDDEAWFIKELCAQEYFELLIEVYRSADVQTDMAARVKKLADALYFTNFSRPLEQLSHGNKKKVQLIAGLMHQPKVLIVDELRNGLDPLAVIAAEQLVRTESKRGACVVAATHDLWWAQRVADQVLLLADGRVASLETTKKIVHKFGSVEHLFLEVVHANTIM